MSSSREWMYKIDASEFYAGIEDFIKQADMYFRSQGIIDATIKCPCKRCKHLEWKGHEDVKYNLYRYGFIPDYFVWSSHGEQDGRVQTPAHVVHSEAVNLVHNMVIDAARPDFQHLEFNDSFLETQNIQSTHPSNPPNPDFKKFQDLLFKADEPLYEGCGNYSTLAAMSRLLNIKSDFNMSESCYDRIMEALNDFFPDSKFCSSYYESKKMVSRLGMGYHKIDVCPNGCMLYYKENEEPRNVRLGLCADGFTPFGMSSSTYSCWPVILTPYNLPPWMCMKIPYMFLTIIIPGPQSPKRNIDVFLRPLIDELIQLWEVGVDTYDAYKEQNFQLRATLLWTINDFPAYGMLSGWSTHGKLSCPYCTEKSKAFTLKHGRKPSFFDCHRQFLPINHPFRRNKEAFKKGQVERNDPPPRLSGEEIWSRICHFPRVTGEHYPTGKEFAGFGVHHNWTKRSVFWDLPSWRTNLIRHNLDVMHVEKNVFDNIFNTVIDDKDKTKDNGKARQDLKEYCKREELELVIQDNGRVLKPEALYSLTKEQQQIVLQWVKELKFPDGYASNLSRRVDLSKGKLAKMKSHDCHVFMERLLPIAFRELLPEPIWKAMTEVSLFFRDLCSTTLQEHQLKNMERNIVVTLCKLEKILPPGFFDHMEHLIVHLSYEARVGGPVQYRWMYPFERYLYHLKKKINNTARVESSICESYIMEEISNFCSHYFESHVQTKSTRVGRNDGSVNVSHNGSGLSIFNHHGRPSGTCKRRYLDDEEYNIAIFYVLQNCEEILPFFKVFETELKKRITIYNN